MTAAQDPMASSSSSSATRIDALIKDRATLRALRSLALQLQRRQVAGPSHVAAITAKTLRSVVSTTKFQNVEELVQVIRAAGGFLQEAQPGEQVVGNITLRVLHLLREEMKALITPMPSTAHSEAVSPIFSPGSSAPPTPGGAMMNSFSSSSAAFSPGPLSSPQRDPFEMLRPGLVGRSDSSFGSFSIADLIGSASASGPSGSLVASAAVSTTGSAVNSDGARTPTRTSGTGASLPAVGAPGAATRSFSSFFAAKERRRGDTSMDLDEEDEDDEEENEDDEDDEDDEDGEMEDESSTMSRSGTQTTSKGRSVKASAQPANTFAHQLKPLLIQAIQELLDEIETVDSSVARDARDHIHSGEIVLTMGCSGTVQAFLKAAAKDRKFTVIVAETAPSFSGHQTARSLSAAGISTILVPDASIFSMMPRVSKVILGAHAVLANGGLLGEAGCAITALAARNSSTPIVVCSGVYKICPHWEWAAASGSDGGVGGLRIGDGSGSSLNLVVAGVGFTHPPSQVLSFNDSAVGAEVIENTEVVSPMLEYVSPQHVDVYITNVGDFPPSYVYRLIKENYHEDDLRPVA